MGQCVDRDEPPIDQKANPDEWDSMVAGGRGSQSVDMHLRRHFLSRAYGNGLDLEDPSSGYALERLDDVYWHRASKIRIWSHAVDLSAPGDEELEVVFHYTTTSSLQTIMEGPILSIEMLEILKDDIVPFGPAVYASRREPSALSGLNGGIAQPVKILNDPKIGGGPIVKKDPATRPGEDCCLAILAPKSMVIDAALLNRGGGDKWRQSEVRGVPPATVEIRAIRCSDIPRVLENAASNSERRSRRILQWREERLGPEHPETLAWLQRLAALLEARGKNAEAAPLRRRALGSSRAPEPETGTLAQSLRPSPSEEARRLDELAAGLRAKGRLEEAEQLYRRALREREAEPGPDHLETLTSANNLAMMLKARGKLAEAEPLYRRVLRGREVQLGPDHRDTLRSINNLAVLLQARGQLEAAEPLYRRAHSGCEAQLGPDHADTLTNMNNLAGLLKTRGRLEDAEPLYRRALEGREKQLGAQHADTLTSLNNLAVLLQMRGQLEEAERLHRRALEGREAKLAPEHPDTLTSAQNLAVLYQAANRQEEAEPLLRRVLRGRETRIGPEHHDTIAAVDNLALCLLAMGKTSEAEPLRQRAFRWREARLSAEHAQALGSQRGLMDLPNTSSARELGSFLPGTNSKLDASGGSTSLGLASKGTA